MPLNVPLIPAQIPQTPIVITPADIQPLIDKLSGAYEEGFGSNKAIQKSAIVGTSDAEAARAKNEASAASSREDQIDASGIQPRQSVISKLFGTKPKTAAAPAGAAGMSGLQHLSTDELLGIANGAGFSVIQ